MLQIYLMIVDTEEDKALFTEVYNEYHNLVYYISDRHLNNHALAEEAEQETFFYVAKNFDKFKQSGEKISSYIATVAHGMAISHFRKEKRHLLYDFDDDVEQIPEIDDSEFDVYDQMTLDDAMDELPELSRNLLQLKYVYGLKSAEIAKIHKLSDANVRKKIERAKKYLKSILEAEE